MSKILKNTTLSTIDISDTGQTVSINGSLTINPQDYDLYSASEDMVSLIGSGSIIVNNGSEDLDKASGIRLIQGGFANRINLTEDLLESDRIKVNVTGTLGDGKVKVSTADSASQYLDEKIVAGSSKITKTIINGGSTEAIQLDIVPTNILTSELNNDASFINSSQAPVQPSDITNFETTTQLNSRDTNNRNRSNHTGTQLSSTISDLTSAVQSAETVTNLTFNNSTKVLTFTNESGTAQTVDLTQFLDDTNLAYIVSGVLNPSTGIVTFTRDDNSTFTADFSSLNDQSFINSAISSHEVTIDNHDDVDVSGASNGDILTFDGTNWIPKRIQYKKHSRTESGLVNQTTTFVNYLNITDTIPKTGLYKISWSYQWSVNTTGNDFIARVRTQNSNDIHTHQQEVKDSAGSGIDLPTTSGGTTNTSTNQRKNTSGYDIVTLTAGSILVELDWKGEVTNIKPAIYKGIISIEEWEE